MRLSHLTALAVMIALVGAMFVVLQSVSAAACVANPNITLGLGKSCDIDVASIHEDATGLAKDDTAATSVARVEQSTVTTDEDSVWTITAADAAGTDDANIGTETVNVLAPDNTNKPDDDDDDEDVVGSFEVTVAGFAISKVEIVDDPDGIVPAGDPIVVRATLRSHVQASVVRLTVPSTGLSITSGTGNAATTTQSIVGNDGAENDGVYDFTVNTAGAPEGEYTLTFTADQDSDFTTRDGTTEGNKQASTTLTVTIGDAGSGIASATLSLGNERDDIPYTADDETKAETGTVAADGGDVKLVIEVFNSLGENASTGHINQITIIAPGGTISSSHATGGPDGATAGGKNSATLNEVDFDDVDSTRASDVEQKTVVTISKTDEKPGTVSVYALVIGSGGAATTETVELVFTGAADAIEVQDATAVLKNINDEIDDDGDTVNDTVRLQVTATDSGGLQATPPTAGVSVSITDADGKRIARNKMTASQPTKGADGNFYITVTGLGSKDAPLAAGEYTVTAKRGGLEDEGTFVVAAGAANIELSVDNAAPTEIGEGIMFTASVTDEDGNPVADGTVVTITASDVRGDADSVLVLALRDVDMNSGSAETKNGEVTGRLVVVGAGSAVVTASSGAGFDAVVVTSTAGASDSAMPEEEASVACLSTLSGFSTWSCGVESSASEIFGLVSGRGATALHLWNGSAWVRYSVVDGTMVPGSSDFMVAENDILYISN